MEKVTAVIVPRRDRRQDVSDHQRILFVEDDLDAVDVRHYEMRDSLKEEFLETNRRITNLTRTAFGLLVTTFGLMVAAIINLLVR